MSLEDIAAVKLAVELCIGPEIKIEILSLPETVSDSKLQLCYEKKLIYWSIKKMWDKNIEKKSADLLNKLCLGKFLQEKVIGNILLIGMRMLIWAKYHEWFLGLSRDFIFNILKSSIFTSKGVIDNKKAAEELLRCESLNIAQRYKLACLYFVDKIPILFRQMSVEEQAEFYDPQDSVMIFQPEIVKFWSYFVMGDVYKLIGELSVDEYMLKLAIRNGSKATVEYCLEGIGIDNKETTIINVILKAVGMVFFISSDENDCWVLLQSSDCYRHHFWIPSDNYVVILCLLFDKMTEDQQISFLLQDINQKYFLKYSGLLSAFLFWPYQNYFLKAINLIWKFLPDKLFADVLVQVCDKIEYEIGSLSYGEEKVYNYKRLLMEYWHASSQSCKRYLFHAERDSSDYYGNGYDFKYFKDVCNKLFLLKNFTNEDRRNVELILDSATEDEKKNFIFSADGIRLCFTLIREEKWGRFNFFVSSFFMCKEHANKFKRELSLTKDAMDYCINFAQDENWASVESFIKCSALSVEEIIMWKREMIFSSNGNKACINILYNSTLETANKYCEWFITSEEELKDFKEYFFSINGNEICLEFVRKGKMDLADDFINWCLSSEEVGRVFKKGFASTKGCHLCKDFILHWNYESFSFGVDSISIFDGSKWEHVKMFLTWCFSSQEEITYFKKDLLVKFGSDILFNLIYANQLKEAETFFSWLDLSLAEIKELKIETLFSHITKIYRSFCGLLSGLTCDNNSKRWKEIELILRWWLVDKRSVLMFKIQLHKGFERYEISGKENYVIQWIALYKCDLIFEELLNNFNIK